MLPVSGNRVLPTFIVVIFAVNCILFWQGYFDNMSLNFSSSASTVASNSNSLRSKDSTIIKTELDKSTSALPPISLIDDKSDIIYPQKKAPPVESYAIVKGLREPLDPPITHPKLRVINAGAPGTNTEAVAEALAELEFVPSVHFHRVYMDKELTKKRSSSASTLLGFIRVCSRDEPDNNLCGKNLMSQRITDYVDEMGSFYRSGGSDLFFMFGPEIIARVPGVAVVISTDDAEKWVNSRLKTHGADPICRPEYWTEPGLLHPFDMAGCVKLSKNYISEVLTTTGAVVRQFSPDKLVRAYQMSIDKTLGIMPKNRVLLLPMVRSDIPDGAKLMFKEKLSFFLGGLTWDEDEKT